MPTPDRMTHEQRAARRKQISNAVKSGENPDNVSRRFGVTTVMVRNACREHNVECKIPRPSMKPPKSHYKRHRLAAKLVKQGLSLEEIGEQLGVKRQRVKQMLDQIGEDATPPDEAAKLRSRKRRAEVESLIREAVRNGASTRSEIAAAAGITPNHPQLRGRFLSERKWNKESIVAALKRFYAARKKPPRASVWATGNRPDYCPDVSTVQRYFGSWNAALEAAGIPTRMWHVADLQTCKCRQCGKSFKRRKVESDSRKLAFCSQEHCRRWRKIAVAKKLQRAGVGPTEIAKRLKVSRYVAWEMLNGRRG